MGERGLREGRFCFVLLGFFGAPLVSDCEANGMRCSGVVQVDVLVSRQRRASLGVS